MEISIINRSSQNVMQCVPCWTNNYWPMHDVSLVTSCFVNDLENVLPTNSVINQKQLDDCP